MTSLIYLYVVLFFYIFFIYLTYIKYQYCPDIFPIKGYFLDISPPLTELTVQYQICPRDKYF